MVLQARFQYNADQTQIAIGYQNEAFIADQVLPDISTGNLSKYDYRRYRLRDTLLIPDTEISREGYANEIEFGHDAIEARTDDFALTSVVPQTDINIAQAAGLPNPLDQHTIWLTEKLLLQKEQKIANIVFDPDLYPTSLKATLAGGDLWSDYTNSDPIPAIMKALDKPFKRPNTMVIARQQFTTLRMHPKVVSAVQANGSGLNQSGVVMATAIAQLLEIDRVLVGSAWYDSSPASPSPTSSRLWGNHCALLHLSPVQLPYTMTFGFTAVTGTRETYTDFDGRRGKLGCWIPKTVMSYKPNICAPEFGYLFSNIVDPATLS